MKLVLMTALAVALAACGQGGVKLAQPSPTPTPLSAALAVDDSTPVILYHDRVNFDQLDGMTWDGATRGRVGAGVQNGGIPNAAGTRYVVGGDVHDRRGNIVAQVPVDTKSFAGVWADDQLHYCGVARISADAPPAGEQGMLQVGLPGQAPRNVTKIGTFYPRGFNGGGPGVAACSLVDDRAIVGQAGGQGIGTAQYWAVQLSSGRVLWTRKPTSSDSSFVVAVVSPNGGYVAENRSGQGVSTATIVGPDGAAVAHVEGWVSAFSWDGSLAVVSGGWTSGGVRLIRWRDGMLLWKGPAGEEYGYWQGVAEPGGARIAVGLRDPAFPQTGGFAPVDLYVIAADGSVVITEKNLYLFTP